MQCISIQFNIVEYSREICDMGDYSREKCNIVQFNIVEYSIAECNREQCDIAYYRVYSTEYSVVRSQEAEVGRYKQR